MSVGSLAVEGTLLVLLLMSILTWGIGLVKYRHNRKLAHQGRAFQDQFWQSQGLADGESVAKAAHGDLAALAQTGFLAYREYQADPHSLRFLGDLQEVIQRPMRQALAGIQRQHEKGLAVLATIGSTAPFVGLFGTVWGIMDALKVIGATGQASIDIVAGPIGEALIATAVGILTAIPAVFLYNFFLRRLKVRHTELEGFIEDFLRVISKGADHAK